MTDQLIMTTAQRDQAMKALQVATTHFAKDRNEIAKAYTMLQSLLMVSAEPAIYTVFDKDGDPVVSFLTKENCHEHINEAVMNNIPDAAKCYVRAMHTSPQALTTKQGIVVTDEMAYAFNRKLTDAPISADECEEIKQGLSAALAHIELPQAPTPITADNAIDEAKKYQWQPIETAPKDGEEIIVMYMHIDTQIVHNGFWLEDPQDPDSTGWWTYLRSEVAREKLEGWRTPKYWMKLPAIAEGKRHENC